MTKSRPHVFGDASAVLSLKVLHASLLFLTSAVISRGLGPEGRGLYYTPLLAATTTIALCNLGLDQANVYLFGSRQVPIRKLVGQSGVVALSAGALGTLALLVFAAIDRSFFAEIPPRMVIVAAFLVPFGVHFILATGLLTLQGRMKAPLVASIGGAVLQLALLAGLALLGIFSPWTVFVSAALSIVLMSVGLATVLAGVRELIAWDGRLLRESLRHSMVLHMGMAFLFLHLRVDMFLVKAMLGTPALGIYSLAVALAEAMMLVTDSLAVALVSRQMRGTIPEAAATALTGARTIALIGLVLSAGWAMLGSGMLGLVFGAAFQAAYAPLLVLLPGITLLGMQRVCGPTVLRADRPWTIAALQAVGFAANIVLNLWWIPHWGLVGTAAASTVSYAVSALGFLTWTSGLVGESAAAAVPRIADVRRVIVAVRTSIRSRSSAAVF